MRGRLVRAKRVVCAGDKQDSDEAQPKAGAGLGSRLVWSAAEAFGNLAALIRPSDASVEVAESAEKDLARAVPVSTEDALTRLRVDYEREYFVTGNMDEDLYLEDCLFADDFASFRGLSRFKANLENLGSFIVDYDLNLLALEVQSEDPLIVQSRVLVKLQLGLPWKPVLAWY